MGSKIAFISGHRDVTEEEFYEHYTPLISDAVLDGCMFVVGDCEGVDDMAQRYLADLDVEGVVVYHMFEEPRYFAEGHSKAGGFQSDVDRDWAMTLASDFDIAWVRKGKERSGTAQNLWRRTLKAEGVTSIKEIMTREAEMFL